MLIQFFLGDVQEIDDAAGMAIFKDYPKIVIFEVGAEVFYDMLVIAQAKNLDLFFYDVYLGQTTCR